MPGSKHAPRGGIPRDHLEQLVEAGLSIRAIAERVGMSYATVQHWLKKYGLRTRRAMQPRGSEARTIERECPVHGLTTFVKYSAQDHHRCEQCRRDRVVARRRRVKELLVQEAGGRCQLCGYDRYLGALQFHTSTRTRKPSVWACAASPVRSSAAATRHASVRCCARTATRRSKRASRPSHRAYYERRADPSGVAHGPG